MSQIRRPGKRSRRSQEGRFHSLSDSDLLGMLFTSGDRLPRAAIDEILRRGTRMIPPLHGIVSDKTSWTRPLPEWWAVVHATYALGAMENPMTLLSLLAALRWADAFDCDWVAEDLPSMFGRLGTTAYQPLRGILDDSTAGWGARSIALAGMAAVALGVDYLREQVVVRSAEIVATPEEELYLRQTAANVLLDFRTREHRDLLLRFAAEEAERKEQDPEHRSVFYDWEVDELLDGKETSDLLEYYRRDWLSFYEPEEMDRREEQWRREQEEMAAEEAAGAPEPDSRDLQRPCHCGSGQPFDRCCYLKVH